MVTTERQVQIHVTQKFFLCGLIAYTLIQSAYSIAEQGYPIYRYLARLYGTGLSGIIPLDSNTGTVVTQTNSRIRHCWEASMKN